MKKILKITLVVGILTSIYACSDFLTETNPNQPVTETFLKDDNTALQTLNSVYSSLQTRGFYKRQYYPVEYMAGDWIPTSGANAQWHDLYLLKFEATNPELVASLWSEAYKGIGRANFAIEAVGDMSPSLFKNETLQKRIIAEAKFLRGLFYFHLVNVYGEVPLVTSIISGADDPNINPRRATVEKVWAAIEKDFNEAILDLPKFENYDNTPGWEKGRVSKGAAQAYLGKSLLYQEKWSDAATALGNLINQPDVYGAYDLLPDYGNVFSEDAQNSIESLFEVQFLGGLGNVWASDDTGGETESQYYGTEFSPYQFANCYVSDELNTFFDNNMTGTDVRRLHTIAREGDTWSGVTVLASEFNQRTIREDINGMPSGVKTGVRKMINGKSEPFLQSGNNIRLLRFADVLLMYAEALNESSAAPNQVAYDAVDEVRLRAGALALPAGLDKAGFRSAIKVERRLELSSGECQRWFDVVRWGDGPTTFASRGYTEANNRYLPVPQSETLLNPSLALPAE